MRPMHTAPRDGTRIMLKVVVVSHNHRGGYDPVYGAYQPVGTAWQESWFDGERWQPWRGSTRTKSTDARRDSQWWVKGWQPVALLEDLPGADVPATPPDSTGDTSPPAGGVPEEVLQAAETCDYVLGNIPLNDSIFSKAVRKLVDYARSEDV